MGTGTSRAIAPRSAKQANEIQMRRVLLPSVVVERLRVTWNAVVDVEGGADIELPSGVVVDRASDITSFYLTSTEVEPKLFNPRVQAILEACRRKRLKVLGVHIDCIPSFQPTTYMRTLAATDRAA